MPIKLNCPRCKTPLQVPSKKAGGYVNCPHCKGRLWVSKDAAIESSQSAPMAEPPLKTEPPPTEYTPVPPKASGPISPAAPLPEPPPAPIPQKKVARFITTEAADSTLRMAADGKLPELQLDEGKGKQKQDDKSSSMNSLLLFGILSISVVVSIMLVMIGPQPQTDSHNAEKANQRYFIEENYFGAGNIDNRPLEPYQVLLREAQQAHTREDFKAERQCYRRVLDMLCAERGPNRKGLTGSHQRDNKLEEAISILLSGQ